MYINIPCESSAVVHSGDAKCHGERCWLLALGCRRPREKNVDLLAPQDTVYADTLTFIAPALGQTHVGQSGCFYCLCTINLQMGNLGVSAGGLLYCSRSSC